MTVRATRRLMLAILITLVFFGLRYAIMEYDASRFRGHYFSGWLLISAVGLLLLFSLRKRISVLPLGRAYVWAQVHNVLGVLASLLLLLHIDEWWPSGLFERLLLIFALGTLLTGLCGIVLNRIIPPQMRKRGERIFLSRIKTQQSVLRETIRSRIVEAIEAGGSRYLLEFYDRQLIPQLAGIRNISSHLVASSAPYEVWQRRFRQAASYFGSKDREAVQDIEAMLRQKMDLDFQFVMQAVLRSWVAIHVMFSALLAVFAILHLVLVYSFGGV